MQTCEDCAVALCAASVVIWCCALHCLNLLTEMQRRLCNYCYCVIQICTKPKSHSLLCISVNAANYIFMNNRS